MKTIIINSATIQLDQFLKWATIVSSGGEAKTIIMDGQIKVNDEITTQRSRKLKAGDIIEYEGNKYRVEQS